MATQRQNPTQAMRELKAMVAGFGSIDLDPATTVRAYRIQMAQRDATLRKRTTQTLRIAKRPSSR